MSDAEFDRAMDAWTASFGLACGVVTLVLVALHRWPDPLTQIAAAACGVGFLLVAAASVWRLR